MKNSKRIIIKYLTQMKMQAQLPNLTEYNKSNSKRKVYSDTDSSQEKGKISS